MNDLSASKFRDYATRVSFNLSLTRKQITVLLMVREMARFDRSGAAADLTDTAQSIIGHFRTLGFPHPDVSVLGVQKLIAMGLVERNAPVVVWGWRLTDAGEHVCRLLELAGLIPVWKQHPAKAA